MFLTIIQVSIHPTAADSVTYNAVYVWKMQYLEQNLDRIATFLVQA